MKRRILKLAVFLLLGMAVNVAVAWGLASGSGVHVYSLVCNPNAAELAWHTAQGERLSTTHGNWVDKSLGWERFQAYLLDSEFEAKWRKDMAAIAEPDGVWPRSPRFHASRVQVGWPMRSMQSSRVAHTTDWWIAHRGSQRAHRVESRGEWSVPFIEHSVPAGPLWPGFAINTIFYVVVCWPLSLVPWNLRKYRRRRRIKRGLCPACAYPVGTSEVCTECGTPRPVRRNADGEISK